MDWRLPQNFGNPKTKLDFQDTFFRKIYQFINYFRSVLEVAVEVAAVAQAVGPVVEALEGKLV